jgi:hypothetical protein
MTRHMVTELASSPHETVIHGLGDLGHILVILIFVALWLGVAFVVLLGGAFLVQFIAENPGGAILCFLVIGLIAGIIGAVIFSSWGWGVDLLFAAGAGVVGTAIMAMHNHS